MRRLTVFGFVSLFLSTAASAQTDSQGNISFEYSYVRGTLSSSSKSPLAPTISSSNLNGWYTSSEYKLVPWLGAVADLGGDDGTERVTPFGEVIPVCPGPLSAQANVQTFLFGPRASVSIGKVTLFAQGLFGGAHASASGTGFSAGWIFASPRVLAGVQSDYLQTRFFGSAQNNFRVSTGVVVRF